MSANFLDDLMAGFAVHAPAKAANAANAANCESWRGLPADRERCEGGRIAAKPEFAAGDLGQDSQVFAEVRDLADPMESEHWRGVSQDSQHSQRVDPALDHPYLAAMAWTDVDIARYLARHARLLRWGWAEPEAEALAERLVIRDRERDARVNCADCAHYRPGRCGNHRQAGLQTAEVGRDRVALLQGCPGFHQEGQVWLRTIG